MSERVIVRTEDRIVRIHLNRPEKKNALTQDMYQRMTDALQAAQADENVAAVVITSEGNVFCAGNDLGDFLRHGELTSDSPVFKFLDTIASIDVPVVAGVQGAAVGIGTTLLLHCDLVYCADDARFVMPFVDMGLVPEAASSQLVPMLCGHLKASALLLLGESVNATEAVSYNLVNKVVAADALTAKIDEVAQALAAKPVKSLRLSKKLLKVPYEPVQGRIARELKDFLQVLGSPETQAIIAAKAR
ncbi:MAG: enoyl-CoA hydratase/isomerase family protein [Idiomarina sp.]|nr:enoyl-CoA hydratase/isomerase family protein [Idiomarina sp.]